MTGIWTQLYGLNGQEIYHNFRGGTGDDAAGLIEAGAKVTTVTKRYEDRTRSITKLTTKMEGAWQGDAAGAAQRGAGPLAVEHGLAQPNMVTAHNTLSSQATAFNTAKSQVTEIPPTPDKPGVWDNLSSFGGAGRTYEDKVGKVNTANDHNVAVMEQYETTTSSNTSAMPTTYGRITDDYSAVGVDRPSPPPPSQPYDPGVSNPNGRGGQNNGSSGHNTGTTGSSFTNTGKQNPPGGNTHQPSGNSQTTPADHRPPVGLPPRTNLPGGNPGQGGGGGGNPAIPGMLPGFGPTGGGGGGGFGPRGSGSFGPGGSGGTGAPGTGGPGAGRGSGFGPGAGGAAAAAEGAAGRGGAAGARGGMGGMHGGGGKRGEGEEDTEHERPSFLVEPDPHDTFGTDEVTAPPVIGE